MSLIGNFYGQPLEWLTSFQTELQAAVRAVALGRSVTIAGRTVSREDMQTLSEALLSVTQEINRQNGGATVPRVIYGDFSQNINV